MLRRNCRGPWATDKMDSSAPSMDPARFADVQISHKWVPSKQNITSKFWLDEWLDGWCFGTHLLNKEYILGVDDCLQRSGWLYNFLNLHQTCPIFGGCSNKVENSSQLHCWFFSSVRNVMLTGFLWFLPLKNVTRLIQCYHTLAINWVTCIKRELLGPDNIKAIIWVTCIKREFTWTRQYKIQCLNRMHQEGPFWTLIPS